MEQEIGIPSTRVAEGACAAVCIGGLGLLVLLAITTKAPATYDEPLHMSTLALLDEKGFSADFIRGLTQGPGPLYTVLQWAAGPLTDRTVPGIRLVNVAGLFVLLALTRPLIAAARALEGPWILASSLIALPVMWKAAGLALTEMPAMVFLTAFALCMVLLSQSAKAPARFAYGALGGLFLGLAVLGRQPSLAAIGAMPVLCRNWRRDLPALALSGSIALMIVLPVFWIWGGLVPPAHRFMDKGVVPAHAVLAFAYAGVLAVILAPRWFVVRPPFVVAAGILAVVIKLLIWTPTQIPLYSVARRIFPQTSLPILGRVSITVMIAFGLLFAFSLVIHMYRNWQNRAVAFMLTATFLLLVTPMKVATGFSARYITMVAPFLVVITASHAPSTPYKALRLAGGVIVGVLSLWSFYQNALD